MAFKDPVKIPQVTTTSDFINKANPTDLSDLSLNELADRYEQIERQGQLVTTQPAKTPRKVSNGLTLLSLLVSQIERMTQKASEPPTDRNPPITLILTFTGRTIRSA